MDQELGYPDRFADRLQLIWGTGFLSPGGADEVRTIVATANIAGKKVLDIGSGLGGAALILAGEYQAEKVIGVDIEANLIERAEQNAAAADLAARTAFRLVEPGPLPLDPGSFDVVFSKDAIVHIEDKLGIYREIFRVLRPGGRLLAGDWLFSEDADDLPAFRHYRETSHLSFVMQTAAEAEAALGAAGFADVELTDRNAWYATFAQDQVDRIEGPLRGQLIEVCGADQYDAILKVSRANASAAACGGLRPTHIRARRPNGP